MKIYLDMDGVIADFFGGLQQYYGVSHWKQLPNIRVSIDDLKNTDFFNTLDVFPTSRLLVDFVKVLAGDNYGICSSPLRGDHQNSGYWKRVWLDRHGFMPLTENLIFTGMKQKYAKGLREQPNTVGCSRPNILVDDKPKNIDSWNDAGGIGILYQANQDSIDELFAKLKEAYDE